jgi:L-serine dehydratase
MPPERSSIFDMIGPVMIGPSSSHTAGVVRIARVAIRILAEPLEEAVITFYNSFARTYEGHGSDRAIIAGLLDFKTDDVRIRDSFTHAEKAGLQYSMRSVGNASTMHPNTIRLELKGKSRSVNIVGQSLGGGVINICEVNGFAAGFNATLHTLIILAEDVKGSIAFISSVIAHDNCNIANMVVSRKGKNDLACQVIEMDTSLKPLTIEYLRSLSWIRELTFIPNIDL